MTDRLTLQAYDWKIEDTSIDPNHTNILAWCLDRESEPHLLRFDDFPAFCQVELPAYVRGYPFNWGADAVSDLVRDIASRLGPGSLGDRPDHAPTSYHFRMSKKTYYYSGNVTHPMLTLMFDTLEAMRHATNLLNKPFMSGRFGWLRCSVWEESISMIRKMLTIRETGFAQWFTVEAQPVEAELHISTLKREYIVKWESLTPIPIAQTQSWVTKPRALAWDIEVYSDNHKAFPNKYNSAHVAYMISCVFQRLGDPKETRQRIGIIYGDCNLIPPDKLANCTIIKVETEEALIEEYARVIRELDPELLIGYNIMGFDTAYLDHRIRRRMRTWPQMGRLIGRVPPMIKPKTWKSDAYGYQSLSILEIDGRASIDLLPVIQRDYKMELYNLDSVARRFLGRGKHDITPEQMFKIFEELLTATKLFKELQPHDPEELRARVTARFEAAKEEMTRVMRYCIEDSELLLDLMDKLKIWVGLLELANVVGVPIVTLFTGGQQQRCFSMLYNLAAKLGFVLDKREMPKQPFKGGFVFEPKPGLYDNIICLDFASLYPSIIRAYNICYTTLIRPEFDEQIKDEDCHVLEFDQEEDDEDDDEDMLGATKRAKSKTKQTKHYRFRFWKHTEGLLPRLVRELVEERTRVRELLDKEKDPVRKDTLNARQLALKVTANSFFGFVSVQDGGKMPLIEGGMSITGMGRILINAVNEYIREKHKGEVVYNDTDSSMVLIPTITTGKEANAMGHQLSREISGTPEVRDAEGKVIQEAVPGLFPPPLAMAFEKAMRLLVLKKKKYAAVLIDKSGELKLDEKDIMKKGIVMARRDNCKWLQKTYMKVLMHVLRREPLANAIDDLVDSIKEFMAGKVPVEDLYIIKSLGSNYASETYYMKVYGDYLRSIGKPAQPGDRLQFLIVKDLTARLLGQKMRPPDVYHDKLGTPEEEQVDHMYYIEKVLMNAMDQLIAFGYQSQIAQLSHIGYRPSNRHKMVGLSRPVKMIIHMLNSKVDIDLLKQAVRSGQVSVAPSVAPPRLTIKPLSPIKLATPPAPMVKLATPPTLPILRPASAPALKPALPQGLASPGSTSIKLRLVTTGNGGSAPSSPAVAVNPSAPGSARIPSPIMPVIAPIAAIVRSPIRLVISPSQVKLSPLRSTGPDAH